MLFWLPKGLFFWSPVLLLCVAGMWMLRGSLRAFRWSTLAVFVTLTWLVGSWYDWQFGGSYGHRGFTDLLPLLSLPMAAVLHQSTTARPLIRIVGISLITASVALLLFQMLQYWNGLIPFQNTTWPEYTAIFLQWP